MNNKNFLLGYGERLTEKIAAPLKRSNKSHPYTFQESRIRLLPQLERLVSVIDSLPPTMCPGDQAVGVITLHPSYLAKSHYPEILLRSLDLTPVGSRSHKFTPKKSSGKRPPKESISADIFVSGTRQCFHEWLTKLPTWTDSSKEAGDFIKIEELGFFSPEEKVRPFTTKNAVTLAEIVLHASKEDAFILEGFRKYLKSLDITFNIDKRFHSRNLCFIPMEVPKRLVPEIAKFSFLRVIREMPRLRSIDPVLRSAPISESFPISLPKEGPIDPNIKVAVFDGGTIDAPEFHPWVKRYKTKGIGIAEPSQQKHGTMVTSAVLFGCLKKGEAPERPYAPVDHYRVLDKDTGNSNDLPEVLERILDVLQREQYNFINLSIGPALPIEDDDVHMWTSMLDEQLANGNVLASIAVGNQGHLDRKSGNARIQVPSDCVNALSVGACNTKGTDWKRANYSSIGPGRSPGVVKPDIVAFGGADKEPFWAFDANPKNIAFPTGGTSFAAPAALRMAIGVRASLGSALNQLALKALLINRADKSKHSREEIGWGRVPGTLDDLIVCKEGTVNVVYQGTLTSGQWLRASIPTPTKSITGPVTISATFCFTTETDPQDPINYTRSGLEIVFRPNKKARTDPSSVNADSDSFFKAREFYPTESELRKDAHKWETTVHASRKFKGDNLYEPVFDIHYNARVAGAPHRGESRKIPYALVVSVNAPQVPNLYDQVSVRYRNRLEALRPVVEIPIRQKGT